MLATALHSTGRNLLSPEIEPVAPCFVRDVYCGNALPVDSAEPLFRTAPPSLLLHSIHLVRLYSPGTADAGGTRHE